MLFAMWLPFSLGSRHLAWMYTSAENVSLIVSISPSFMNTTCTYTVVCRYTRTTTMYTGVVLRSKGKFRYAKSRWISNRNWRQIWVVQLLFTIKFCLNSFIIFLGNSADKLRHPRCVAYSVFSCRVAELVCTVSKQENRSMQTKGQDYCIGTAREMSVDINATQICCCLFGRSCAS